MTPIRVALVAFTTTGAAGDYVSALGEAMSARTPVSIWIPDHPPLEVVGAEIHALDKARSRLSVATQEALACVAPSTVARHISAWKPDVTHIVFGEGYPSAAKAAHSLRGTMTVVATWHDPRSHGQPLDRVQHTVARQTMRSVQGIHVHCEGLHAPNVGVDVLVAEHPVFPCRLCEDSATTDPVHPEGAIAFVGRFAPYKGVDVLCAALADYWRRGGDRSLLVVGQGRVPAALRDLESRWRSLVTIVNDYVPNDRLHDVLSGAAVCVMPYLTGTQSALPWLARAHGAHLVASDVGCIGAVTRRIGGRVVQPGSVSDLVDAFFEPPSEWTDIAHMPMPTFVQLTEQLLAWYPRLTAG